MARFVVFVFAFTLGCGGGRARDGGAVFGNAATLNGDPVGLASDPAGTITRMIPATVSGSDITGTSAILGRQTATSDVYTFIAPVTNHGGRRRCFVQEATFDLLDGAGATIGAQPNGFVTGSVGKLKNGTMHTATCVDVGETGYLLELFAAQPDFAAVASARITLTSSDSEWVAPETAIVPISYSAPVRNKEYMVTVANQGPVTGTVNMSTAIFFDDTDTPAYWGFLYSGSAIKSAPYDLAPGATYQLSSGASTETWTGNSTKQLVLVDFNVLPSAKALTLSPDPDAEAAAAVERWREELAKKLTARK